MTIFFAKVVFFTYICVNIEDNLYINIIYNNDYATNKRCIPASPQ